MTLEDLADLIRANSASTNGRIDGLRNETNAALMNIQNDLTDIRGEIKEVQTDLTTVKSDVSALKHDMVEVKSDVAGLKDDMVEVKSNVAEVKRSLDLATTVASMRREIDALVAEVADLKGRAS